MQSTFSIEFTLYHENPIPDPHTLIHYLLHCHNGEHIPPLPYTDPDNHAIVSHTALTQPFRNLET